MCVVFCGLCAYMSAYAHIHMHTFMEDRQQPRLSFLRSYQLCSFAILEQVLISCICLPSSEKASTLCPASFHLGSEDQTQVLLLARQVPSWLSISPALSDCNVHYNPPLQWRSIGQWENSEKPQEVWKLDARWLWASGLLPLWAASLL